MRFKLKDVVFYKNTKYLICFVGNSCYDIIDLEKTSYLVMISDKDIISELEYKRLNRYKKLNNLLNI